MRATEKQKFSPHNRKHMEHVKEFLEKGTWGGSCPFYLEEEYGTIPAMIFEKVARKVVGLN